MERIRTNTSSSSHTQTAWRAPSRKQSGSAWLAACGLASTLTLITVVCLSAAGLIVAQPSSAATQVQNTANSTIAPSPVAITHAQGTVHLAAMPQKTAVYDLASLDTLQALGIEASAVPVAPLPASLEHYADKRYPKIGTLFEPDYEAVHAHQPDLIIVAERSAAKQPQLSRLAPTVDLTVNRDHLVDSIKQNTRTLANLYGKQDLAEQQIAKLDEALNAVREASATAGNGLIILTVGGKMSAYGPGSRFGVIHDVFGLQPLVADLDTSNHGQAISHEFIRKNNPDWLFVIDRDAAIGLEGAAAQKLLDNPLIHKTRAWQNNQVVYLNNTNWYLLGTASLTSLQAAADEVRNALAKQP